MKLYIGPDRLRIVGKAWEVREKLKQAAKANGTLKEWLSRRTPSSL